jgi:protein-S-isoprenylcysteine O-methyltransferase Ste14
LPGGAAAHQDAANDDGSAFFIREITIRRRAWARRTRRTVAMHALELKVPPGVLALVCGAAMWGIGALTPEFAIRVPGRGFWAAGLFGAGLMVAAAGVVSFRQVKTTWNPMKPHTATVLVTTGIYARTRNPMYLGVLLLLLGWACILANALTCLILPGFVAYLNRYQIRPEERALAALYGREFAVYRQRVRRWI